MLDYNIVQGEDVNSLERLLYIFICKDKNKRRELYSGDKLMDKVNEKLENLTNDFSDLYYDPIELRKEVVYELGLKDGIENGKNEKSIEIAQAMLKENIPKATIIKVTGLTKTDIDSLKEENK